MLFGPTKQDIRDGIGEAIDPKTNIRTFYEIVGRKLLKDGRWEQTRLGKLSEYAMQPEITERLVSKCFDGYDIDTVFFFELQEASTYYPLTYETKDNSYLSPIPKYVFINTSSGIKRVQDISELNSYIAAEVRYEDTKS